MFICNLHHVVLILATYISSAGILFMSLQFQTKDLGDENSKMIVLKLGSRIRPDSGVFVGIGIQNGWIRNF